ncbi:MAG: PEP-CTERM sorting domain-containing protein [Gemmatimonadaceae bacterium]
MVGSLAFGALVASSSSALAQDQLNFTGTAQLSDVEGNPSQLFINFLGANGGTIVADETISGGFATTIVPGTLGTIQDLVVEESGVVGLPVDPFIGIGGFSFTLTGAPNGNTFGPISLFDIGTGTAGTFGFSGTVTGGAYGDVGQSYQGVFTAQFSGQSPEDVFNQVNSGGTLPVTFSANVIVGQSVIPEPSTYLLLATGLGALALVGLRRRSMQS